MHRLERLYVELPAFRPGSIGAYALAVMIVAVATVFRLAIDPFVEGIQYITFFPAVIVTTFVSGVRAGFLSLVLCAVAAWIFILPPSGQLKVGTSEQIVTIGFFIVIASADVLVIGALRFTISHYRRLSEKLAAQTAEMMAGEEQKQLISAELDHRAKNLLAVVQSILRQTRAETIDSYVQAVSGRIMALSRSHSLIAASRWQGADVARIVSEELEPYQSLGEEPFQSARVRAVGAHVNLRPSAAQTLAMAIHELTTNAVKYGALSRAEGRIAVGWQRTEDGLLFSWSETGGPPMSQTPERQGFGTRFIASGIERQLRGRLTYDWRPEGLLIRILVPSEHLGLGSEDSQRGEEPTSTAPNAHNRRSLLAHRRILVVEDEALIAMQMEDILTEEGCSVVGPAARLDGAMALASSERLDAAILDVNLSGARTEPVADVLRRDGIPFIVLTGYASDAVSAVFAGAPVMAKPFDRETLLDVLAREISNRAKGPAYGTMA
jgi:two-component sensor histidine kinase/ActR/RegA family two-component response regulator